MVTPVEKLHQLFAPTVEAQGFELYGCVFRTENHYSTLIVYIDSPNGVNCDDCAKISRSLSAVLDVEDPINGRYHLEVSTPGVDRPLFHRSHYERAVGSKIKVRLRKAHDNRRNMVGILNSVREEQVSLLLEDGNQISIPFEFIEKAKLISEL